MINSKLGNSNHLYANAFSEMLGSIYLRNGDTLGLVELIVWLEQGNQGDQREQDDQGEVSIIIRVFHKLHFAKKKRCNTSTHPSQVYINQI